jgi:hypothetical protein
VLAYKFLDRQGRTAIQAVQWPLPEGERPGPWVEAAAARPCREGIHACRPQDLAYWIHHELWEIELDGEVVEAERKIVARRGRLVRRFDEWADGVLREFDDWCAWRARDYAVTVLDQTGHHQWAQRLREAGSLEDLAEVGHRAATALDDDSGPGSAAGLAGDVGLVAPTDLVAAPPFIAACAAGHAATHESGTRHEFDRAYAGERAVQSDWVAGRLGLA